MWAIRELWNKLYPLQEESVPLLVSRVVFVKDVILQLDHVSGTT